ncbi:MAG: hypothetical protein JXB40_03330 [Candidatus Omnitrophica bacterium]|nr:hypothetical protein [Candidatus Omnitrophota bacterium]
MTTKDIKSLLLNIGILMVFAGLVMVAVRSCHKEAVIITPPVVQAPKDVAQEASVYRLEDQKALSDQTPSKNLNEVFEKYPRSDAGENMVAQWAAVSAADKAKLAGLLDKSIDDSKAALANNPENKRAKKLLKISEGLKKMASNNFDYKLAPDEKMGAADGDRK